MGSLHPDPSTSTEQPNQPHDIRRKVRVPYRWLTLYLQQKKTFHFLAASVSVVTSKQTRPCRQIHELDFWFLSQTRKRGIPISLLAETRKRILRTAITPSRYKHRKSGAPQLWLLVASRWLTNVKDAWALTTEVLSDVRRTARFPSSLCLIFNCLKWQSPHGCGSQANHGYSPTLNSFVSSFVEGASQKYLCMRSCRDESLRNHTPTEDELTS